jgi:pimeloyl-ACP methyl ester carboxylesterase
MGANMRIDTKMANINYDIIGQGIPVLLIHGFSLDNNVMKGAYEPIFRKLNGFKRVYIDLPAMGKSIVKDGFKGTEDILECLFEFIDKVIGREKFIVIGQSYGGYLAQAIIASIPGKTFGLGLLCPLILADSEDRDLPEHQCVEDKNKYIIYEDKEAFEDYMEFAVIANQTTYNRYKEDILIGFRNASDDILKVIREDYYELHPEPYEQIKEYDKPSLILVSKQDSTVGYKDVRKLETKLSNLTIKIVEGAGHALQYEQETMFNELTINWLKEFR